MVTLSPAAHALGGCHGVITEAWSPAADFRNAGYFRNGDFRNRRGR
jgi:hypothetical protein